MGATHEGDLSPEDQALHDAALAHWRSVKKHCEAFHEGFTVECIDAYYKYLDNSNELEWVIALGQYWKNQPFIALFGIPISLISLVWAILITANPGLKPDINDVPWEQFDEGRKFMN